MTVVSPVTTRLELALSAVLKLDYSEDLRIFVLGLLSQGPSFPSGEFSIDGILCWD